MYHLHIALHSFLATSWATARKPWIDTSGATTTLSTTSCFPRAGRTRALCWPGGQEDKWCDHTPDVAMTAQKPDLVIVNWKTNPLEVTLVELIVPWNSSANIRAALQRKTERYNDLQTTIEGNASTFLLKSAPEASSTRGIEAWSPTFATSWRWRSEPGDQNAQQAGGSWLLHHL